MTDQVLAFDHRPQAVKHGLSLTGPGLLLVVHGTVHPPVLLTELNYLITVKHIIVEYGIYCMCVIVV